MYLYRFFKYCLVPVLGLQIFCSSCAQKKLSVTRLYGFYTERIPGTIMAGPDGNPLPVRIDTIYTAYAETTSDSVVWDTAWNHNRVYALTALIIKDSVWEAGTDWRTREKIMIRHPGKRYLFRLSLSPVDKKGIPPRQLRPGQILIKGRYKKKPFFKIISQQTQLEAIPSV